MAFDYEPRPENWHGQVVTGDDIAKQTRAGLRAQEVKFGELGTQVAGLDSIAKAARDGVTEQAERLDEVIAKQAKPGFVMPKMSLLMGNPGISATQFAMVDHVHPSDTHKASLTDGKVSFNQLPLVTTSTPGAMSAADKIKLDELSTQVTGIDGIAKAARDGVTEQAERIDDLLANQLKPSSVGPQMDGAASFGTLHEFARGDHRHPSDTGKADLVNRKIVATQLPLATTSIPGAMSPADKRKLDGLPTTMSMPIAQTLSFGAGANMQSVGGIGSVTLPEGGTWLCLLSEATADDVGESVVPLNHRIATGGSVIEHGQDGIVLAWRIV